MQALFFVIESLFHIYCFFIISGSICDFVFHETCVYKYEVTVTIFSGHIIVMDNVDF